MDFCKSGMSKCELPFPICDNPALYGGCNGPNQLFFKDSCSKTCGFCQDSSSPTTPAQPATTTKAPASSSPTTPAQQATTTKAPASSSPTTPARPATTTKAPASSCRDQCGAGSHDCPWGMSNSCNQDMIFGGCNGINSQSYAKYCKKKCKLC